MKESDRYARPGGDLSPHVKFPAAIESSTGGSPKQDGGSVISLFFSEIFILKSDTQRPL